MPITAADWYDLDPDLKNLYQGDVLDGVPLVYAPAKNVRWVLLRPLPEGPLENARGGLPRSFRASIDVGFPSAWNRVDGELVMATAIVHRGMILSRSCNLDWRKQIQVAPVFTVEGVEEKALASLRENDNAFSFYLPPDGQAMPESYADLSQVATVHVSYLRRTDYLVRRLTSQATVELQDILSEYYAKPFGFNTKDSVPQKALYRCIGCFFSAVTECPPIEMDIGDNFPPCPTCKENALWVKVSQDVA
jgi:hypothetical protein